MDQFEEQQNGFEEQHTNKGNIGWGVLGFFIPLVGLILFLVWKTDRPADAKCAGVGALIGFILNIVVCVIYVIFFGMAIAGLQNLGAVALI